MRPQRRPGRLDVVIRKYWEVDLGAKKYSWCNPPSTELARTVTSSRKRYHDLSRTHAHFARFGSLEGAARSGTEGDQRGLRGDLQGGGRCAGASAGTTQRGENCASEGRKAPGERSRPAKRTTAFSMDACGRATQPERHGSRKSGRICDHCRRGLCRRIGRATRRCRAPARYAS